MFTIIVAPLLAVVWRDFWLSPCLTSQPWKSAYCV